MPGRDSGSLLPNPCPWTINVVFQFNSTLYMWSCETKTAPSGLKMERVCFSETLVSTYECTWRHNTAKSSSSPPRELQIAHKTMSFNNLRISNTCKFGQTSMPRHKDTHAQSVLSFNCAERDCAILTELGYRLHAVQLIATQRVQTQVMNSFH
jgi:hypothetical protein